MPTRRIPSYRLHKPTGQAIVTLNGRMIYLGKHGTDASRQKYDRLIAEWLAQGRMTPERTPDGWTITQLVVAFLKFAATYYVKDGKPTAEVDCIRSALKPLRRLYGDEMARDFGPMKLKAVRQEMIAAGWSRKYVNKSVDRLRRCFRWATAAEKIPPTVITALDAVEPLKEGRTEARETDAVEPVDESDLQATLQELHRTNASVADMVDIQRLTGMRPEEVSAICRTDIDRSGDIWIYRPDSHKMEHKARKRWIAIGPRAQRILTPYLLRPDDQPCFVTRYATPRTTRSYRDCINRACQRAKVAKWNPNQLRHSAATAIRAAFDLETARAVLSHGDKSTTEIYAEKDLEQAKAVARKLG